jgi:hypothetical protein
MIVLSFETKKDQQEIFAKATNYFVDKVGLKVADQDDCCVHFEDENQLGHVKVTLAQKDGQFEVTVESKEFEYHAKKFVSDFK